MGVKEFQRLLWLQAQEEDLEKLLDLNTVRKWHALLHILYQQDGNRCMKEHCTHQKEWGILPVAPML